MRWALLLVGLVIAPALDSLVVYQLQPQLDAELDTLKDWRPAMVCEVYDQHGERFDTVVLERRVWADFSEMAPVVWQAVVAAEDRRFFSHRGVDPEGILRAAITNAQAGRVVEGGSTLTQQLVKNTVVGNVKSYERKAREAALALRLEQTLDKQRILELYLNLVYFGSGNYGVEAAAQDYFGKSAGALNASEAALLAGLIPSPSRWSPRRDLSTALSKRRRVLAAMEALGFLTASEREEAEATVPTIRERHWDQQTTGTSYRTVLRRQLRDRFGEQWPFFQGLKVYTAVDPEIQALAEEQVRLAAEGVEARQGFPYAPTQSEDQPTGTGQGLAMQGMGPEAIGSCFKGTYGPKGSVEHGGQTYLMHEDSLAQRVRTADPEKPAKRFEQVVRPGDSFDVCVVEPGVVRRTVRPWAEAAAVVMELDTGRIIALAGGRSPVLEGFDRVTQAKRQPGSSFKPYVYGSAIEAGKSQLDWVWDRPFSLRGTNGRRWSPKNYGRRYQGRMTMGRAFAKSLNTVAVQLAAFSGVDAVADFAARAGVRSELRRDFTLALGSSEVTPMEQVVAIATLARGGRHLEPVWIDELRDYHGEVLGRAGGEVRGLELTLPGSEGPQVIAPEVAWQVSDLMRGTIERGTGIRARRKGADRGGKTGTTSGYVDAWFVGFTAKHAIVVWVGEDAVGSLGYKETGSRAALPAWKALAEALEGEEPPPRRTPPPQVMMVTSEEGVRGVPPEAVPSHVMRTRTPHPQIPLPKFPGN